MGREGWVRIVPFAVFMAFVGVEQGLHRLLDQGSTALNGQHLLYLYPAKAVLVAVLLLFFRQAYSELKLSDFKKLSHTCGSVLLGLVVFLLWINMDWEVVTFGDNKGFNPFLNENAATRNLLIAFRLFGAVLVVPVMEELFWRSFLLRYIINSDFAGVRVGSYTFSSFLVGSVLFGLEHHLVLAGVMAGMAYSLLLYRTKSINQCILAHGVTNLALGVYVLQTGYWQFW